MSHLVGIDKGPVMDWTNDSGIDEHYRKWKKQVEVIFKGPLNEVNLRQWNAIKWSTGVEIMAWT